MSFLPRLLIVDDVYGASIGGRNRHRRNFCFRIGIRDVTGDVEAEEISNPLAEAVFSSGQRIGGGVVENDPEGVLHTAKEGFASRPRWSLMLVDLHFKTGRLVDGEAPGKDRDRAPTNYFGLEVLRAVREQAGLNDLEVVLLSAMNREDVEAVIAELGAVDFCDKSALDRERLEQLLFEHGLLEDGRLIGTSVSFLSCLRQARRRSMQGTDNILIFGETGTGKELLAEYIHRMSGRSGPYVPLFTQGVPETLIEDRLFGHEKGAFAGAQGRVAGAAERADGGTLFIDEFAEIPASVQAKLLRLLDRETREVQRIGGTEILKLDLQVVMATNDANQLRSDDYRFDLTERARLNAPILLPPLRSRREDIPLLTEHFVRKHESRLVAPQRVVSDGALRTLMETRWPGNIRELDSVIEQAVTEYRGLKVLARAHLPKKLQEVDDGGKPAGPPNDEVGLSGQERWDGGPEFDALLNAVAGISSERLDPHDLNEALPRWRRAHARFAAQLLKAALACTARFTPKAPEGEILIQPALRLLTGDSELTATNAKRLVKRLLNISPADIADLLEDPVLSAAARRVGITEQEGKGRAVECQFRE